MLKKLGAKAKALPVFVLLLLAAACSRDTAQNSHQKSRASSIAQATAPQPRVYPYSVVPGGIHSVQDFSSKPDAIARKHYQGLRATGVVENRRVGLWYVSYRKNGKVYWTRKQLSIQAGEKLVQLTGSDKILYARTRCGNLLSITPQTPTLAPADEKNIIAEANHVVPVGDVAVIHPPAVVPADLKAAIDLPVPAAGIANDPKASMAQNGLGDSAPLGAGGFGGGGGGVGSGGSSSSGSSSSGSTASNSGSGSSSGNKSTNGQTHSTSGSSGGSSAQPANNTVAAGGDPGGSSTTTNPTVTPTTDPTNTTSGTTNSFARNDDVMPVPEPGDGLLFLSGMTLGGLIWRRRRAV